MIRVLAFVVLGIVALLLAGCVTTVAANGRPPEPYRSEGAAMDRAGQITWVRYDQATFNRFCGTTPHGIVEACARLYTPMVCIVYVAPGVPLDAGLREHEGAHCAGWPWNHPVGRGRDRHPQTGARQ